MLGMRESPATQNGAAANGDASASSSSPFAWGEDFMNIVAKYERNSERQLYVYGISVSRCASCRHKTKSGAKECENCGHVVLTKLLNCMRCAVANPGLWCFECDAYFCGPCRNEPHVLVLNGSAPAKHNCFPIDGSSGKLLRSGAWSSSLLAMAKTARRSLMTLGERQQRENKATKTDANAAGLAAGMENLRSDDKTSTAKKEKERKLAAKETPRPLINNRLPTVPVSSNRQPSESLAAPVRPPQPKSLQTRGSAHSRSPSPVPPLSQQPPHPKAQRSPSYSPIKEPSTAHKPPLPTRSNIVGEVPSTTPALSASKKRKSPTVDADGVRDQSRSAPSVPQRPLPGRETTTHDADSSATAPLTIESDGMSLTARLRQMKDKQYQHLLSASSSPATHVKGEPIVTPSTSPPLAPTAANRLSQTPLEATQEVTTEPDQRSLSAPPAGHLNTNTSAPRTAPPLSVKVDPMLDDVLSRPIESPPAPLVGVPAAAAQAASIDGVSVDFSAGSTDSALAAGAEDVLQGAVVDEYDRVNAYVFGIEAKLQYLIDVVRRASLQDVTRAAMTNARVVEYRKALRTAEEHRERALANVILFSPAIREFVRTLSAATLQEIPQVLPASHRKCAELAQKIRDAKTKHQELRAAIDRAVSSGDMVQIMQLQTLGSSISLIEEQIRGHKKDRDGQFQLMFQFSKRLRDSVQVAIAAIEQQRQSFSSSRGST